MFTIKWLKLILNNVEMNSPNLEGNTGEKRPELMTCAWPTLFKRTHVTTKMFGSKNCGAIVSYSHHDTHTPLRCLRIKASLVSLVCINLDCWDEEKYFSS